MLEMAAAQLKLPVVGSGAPGRRIVVQGGARNWRFAN